jgi:hypothetical protein
MAVLRGTVYVVRIDRPDVFVAAVDAPSLLPLIDNLLEARSCTPQVSGRPESLPTSSLVLQ